MDTTITPSHLQPSYNSETNTLISIKWTPINAPYTISPAVSNIVIMGDLHDLERSITGFHRLQLSYNSGTTGLISIKVPPIDAPHSSPYAVRDVISRFEYGDLG